MQALFPHQESNSDLPLPLLVAQQWDFPLAYHEQDGVIWYAVQDWIAGLLSVNTTKVRKTWNDIQRRGLVELSDSIRHLPYVASDGKTYQLDHTTDKGLYLIAQNLRATKGRVLLADIKEFLAKAGVFVDEVRRDPSYALSSGAIDPDDALQAIIDQYRQQGKDDNWINARLNGIMARNRFTAALKVAIKDIIQNHYAMATNEVYVGLWQRTADHLKKELDLPKNANLRDNQPTLGLLYQMLAEEACAKKLGSEQELSILMGLEIIREIAELIGEQAHKTSQYFGMDLATGRPLLTGAD